MANEIYLRGFEDAIEMVLDMLRQKGLLTPEIENTILRALATAKENKLQHIRRQLGLF
ncbi:hypothetical protein JdFRA1000001_40c [uncultured archaeal virus]|uniref:Uncharacterized protein n=1 Tax=uncultured archaeal virus TaxID=1960247 RepID=A0A1S5Y356_9VIRU|nr:hypothetical protein JdFRA1000001_40c [uncultured archaeal virus]